MYKKLIFNFLFIIINLSLLRAQVIANFSSDKIAGCVPLLINFDNQSLGLDSLSFIWSFGNGNNSTITNPQAAYILPGKYTVTLIAFNDSVADTLTLIDYITVYPKPIVDFATISPNQGCFPLKVKFENKSISDAGIASSIWTLGDGNMSFVTNPIYDYNESGFYSISLKVSDNNGCENSTFKNNYISVVEKPILDFITDKSFACDTPALIKTINLSENQDITTFNWFFGDATTSTSVSPEHSYENSGIYDITLIGTNQYSCSDTLIKEHIFNIGTLTAKFELEKNIFCKGENITFYNSSINATNYSWSFGDGTTSNLLNPEHIYSNDGIYIVKLRISNTESCFDEYIDTIKIESVSANFITDENYSCIETLNVNFTNLSENSTQWEWHLGNGIVSFEQNPSNIYVLENGYRQDFNDTLIVKNDIGCTDTIIKEKNIIISIPRVYCTPNNALSYISQVEGCTPVIVNFNNESTYDSEYDNITSVLWDFDDGTTSTSNNPSHVFEEIREYNTSLTITTQKGCSRQTNVTVSVGTKQNASFEVQGISEMCANYAFHFVNTSSDLNLIDEYSWIFTDGEIVNSQNVNHNFLEVGVGGASLAVGYNGCWSDIYVDTNAIYTEGALCMFDVIQNCENSYDVTFEGKIVDATYWYWNFGDNQIDYSNQETITHTYGQSGDYTVILTAVNEENDCAYVFEKNIKVRKPVAQYSYSEMYGCPGLEVTFNPLNSQDVSYNYIYNNEQRKYKWLINNTEEFYSNNNIHYTFTQRGKNKVELIVSDIFGCADTMTRYIKIYQPIPDFSVDTNSGCVPFNVHFTNQVQSDTTYRCFWTFENNENICSENLTYNFSIRNSYDVSLYVEDTLGCSNSIFIEDYIEAKKPIPQISISSQEICLGDNIQFNDLNDSVLNYFWNLGDGTTSTLNIFEHIYSSKGEYDVSVNISYDDGCDTTVYLPQYIKVQDFPITDFITDTTYSDCYPFLVKFSPQCISDYNLTYAWNFGDSLLSSNQSPTHSYNIPGDFNVTLKASTPYGCHTTITKPAYIHVGGPYAKIKKPDIICKGQDYIFSLDNELNIYDFRWDMGDGTIKYGDTICHQYNIFGNIYPSLILYSDSLGTCNITLKDSILINLNVADYLIDNLGICETYPINFENISVGAESNIWSINNELITEVSPVYTFNTANLYDVQLITVGSDGCKDSIIKNITIHSLPNVIALSDTLICRGDNAQLTAIGASEYIWYSYEDTLNGNYPVVSPYSTLQFFVYGTDNKGCSNLDSMEVFVQQVPQLYLSNDTTVIIGDNALLVASSDQNVSYTWQPETYLSCTNCSNTFSKPMETTTYTISIEDTSFCFIISDEVEVNVRKEYTIDLPTVFTPNGDGINETILPNGWGVKNILEYSIYNKWGELVYSYDANLSKGWDGTYKGKKQESDTYVYFIKIETYENEILTKKGTFNLVR